MLFLLLAAVLAVGGGMVDVLGLLTALLSKGELCQLFGTLHEESTERVEDEVIVQGAVGFVR